MPWKGSSASPTNGAVLFFPQFIQVSVNSLLYVLCSLAVVLPLGLASALLLQSLGRLGTALRVALLVPWSGRSGYGY
jgi:multiple sugar transport system permease protein